MNPANRRAWPIIWLSLLLALALTLVPLPDWASTLWPAWVTLAVLYWSLAAPQSFGLVQAWLTGLLLDAATAGVLGQHALAMVLIAWAAQRFHLQIRPFPVWQQALVMLPLLATYEFVLYWLSGLMGEVGPVWAWPAVLMGALLWPLNFTVLRLVRQRFRVA